MPDSQGQGHVVAVACERSISSTISLRPGLPSGRELSLQERHVEDAQKRLTRAHDCSLRRRELEVDGRVERGQRQSRE
jgi:hypothetical protein